jgi:hypothetical protein
MLNVSARDLNIMPGQAHIDIDSNQFGENLNTGDIN